MLLPRALIILLGLAAAVVVAGGIRAAAWLVAPVFLALVIVITVHPVHARLRARGLPSWAATTLLVLAVYGVLVVLAGVVVVSVARLATLLPSYAAEVNALLASVTAELARFGVGAARLREIAGTLNYDRLVGIVSGLGGARPDGRTARRAVGVAGVHHQLHSLHRVLDRARPAGAARSASAPRGRPATPWTTPADRRAPTTRRRSDRTARGQPTRVRP